MELYEVYNCETQRFKILTEVEAEKMFGKQQWNKIKSGNDAQYNAKVLKPVR